MEKHSNTPGVAPVPAGTPTQTPEGRTFIGGKSREFQRGGPPDREFTEDPRTGMMNVPSGDVVSDDQTDEAEVTPCMGCAQPVSQEWIHCAYCGAFLYQGNPAKAIGIEITEEDIGEYLFKGYLVKDVELTHGKKATFKTLIPKEGYAIEDTVMEMFKDKDATQNRYSNTYALVNLSYGWMRFDGQSLGDTPEKRLQHLQEAIGIHLLDIASKKWNLFNRAVTAMLEQPDIVKN